MSVITAHTDYPFDKVLDLIQKAFTEQTGKIDPPSSMHKLTISDVKAHAENEIVWVLQNTTTVQACLFGTREGDALYLSKLSVAKSARGKGAARQLIGHAAAYARDQNITKLTLISRIELTGNHSLFEHLGFTKSGFGSHPGYDRPTEIHFEQTL
jgi:GNAT superfamily N-acetyltransferase